MGARVVRMILAGLLAASLAGWPLLTRASELELEPTSLPPELTRLYFPATGHALSGRFLRFWWERGELPIFGYPVTEELIENGRPVQYFERARFEAIGVGPSLTEGVQLTLLGRWATARRQHEAPFRPLAPVADTANRDYFEATGHTLAWGFKEYWEENGGLPIFGYPISEEFSEAGRTVQYFERARFEWHPNNPRSWRVQLGLLGLAAALASDRATAPIARPANATIWTPRLAADLAAERRRRQQQSWLAAQPRAITPFQAVVETSSANLRQAPTTVAGIKGKTYARHILQVVGVATGEPIEGNDQWYQLAQGSYIAAALVRSFTPPPPPRTWSGRWIDVNLSTMYATAYDGDTPWYSALITAGRANRTPLGVFTIQRRVRNETMDSATVGIPPGHPEYYYLENVAFTQYFTGQGHALHGNYWVHPSRFGRFSSNGCIGLRNEDAAWFWSFARVGTPVHIHY